MWHGIICTRVNHAGSEGRIFDTLRISTNSVKKGVKMGPKKGYDGIGLILLLYDTILCLMFDGLEC